VDSKPQLKPRIEVFLDIRGFRGEPDSITHLLGIRPDRAWSKGEIIPERPGYEGPRPLRRKYSCWTIKASLKKYSYNVEDHIKQIIKRISPVRDRIKSIPGANLMLCVWIDIYDPYESTPALVLGTKTMRFLSDIEAVFDVDLSLLIDPEESRKDKKNEGKGTF
jgi:hypothetical protein